MSCITIQQDNRGAKTRTEFLSANFVRNTIQLETWERTSRWNSNLLGSGSTSWIESGKCHHLSSWVCIWGRKGIPKPSKLPPQPPPLLASWSLPSSAKSCMLLLLFTFSLWSGSRNSLSWFLSLPLLMNPFTAFKICLLLCVFELTSTSVPTPSHTSPYILCTILPKKPSNNNKPRSFPQNLREFMATFSLES